MKLGLKSLILVDVAIVLIWTITFFNGGAIGDFLHPNPNKQLYQEANQKIDEIYDSATSDTDCQIKIRELDQFVSAQSKKIYLVSLNGQVDSLPSFDQAVDNLSNRWVYGGDSTMLVVYLGELIRQHSQSEWYVNDNDYLALRSKINDEKVPLYDYVFDRLGGDDAVAQQYFDESVKKLGALP